MANDFAETALEALPPEKLAQALDIVPAVKARIKAIEELAYTRAIQGQSIPGYKLVEKRPTRQWRDEAAVVQWALDNAVDPYEMSVLSPAQMEKRVGEALPKGLKKEAKSRLDPFVERVSSGTALVRADDDRPEVKRIEAKDFAAVDATPQREASGVNLF